MTSCPLLQVLRWRFTNGDIYYWRFLVGSVGVALALTYLCGLVLLVVGCVLPFALIQPV